MERPTFYTWLTREIETSRMALLGLYEKRDRLLYVEAPPLRKRYMELIGAVEEVVLQAELEAAMLRRKIELMQIAVNRRESIDPKAIDQTLEKEKEQRISDLEQADLTLDEIPQLTEQEERSMQRQYREITSRFHPAMNPDVTETEKELYQKAVESYKLRDPEAMKLVYDMLFEPAGQMSLQISLEERERTAEEIRAEYHHTAQVLSTDYRLAKKLYPFFQPLESDRVVLDVLQRYDDERRTVEEQIRQIRSGFPFNAVETMDDSVKTEEYLAELRIRKKRCEEETATLTEQINQMMEGRTDG